MNSSSLSPLKNRSGMKQNASKILPPISNPQTLKYHNDYQSYEDDLNRFKAKQREESVEESSVSKDSSIFSSSLSGSRASNIGARQLPQPSGQMSKGSDLHAKKSQQKIIPYEQSPEFWNASLPQKPHIQYSEREEYNDKSEEQIEREVKSMRRQLQEMNSKLSQKLGGYSMAKSEFTAKELMQPSNSEFYRAQIESNKKVQQGQHAQIQKLHQTELLVKDKDVLIDLQNILIEMRQELHRGKKQQHDCKLKNHKQDLVLDQLIKVNSDNKDNHAVKLLKLQIIYYMKRQNTLKTYEEQLDHEEKLIRQNDQNLQLKVEQLKAKHKLYHLCDQNYTNLLQTYSQLQDKKNTLKKHLDTLKRSNHIASQKLARQLLQTDTLLHKTLPKIAEHSNSIQQIQLNINTLITAYHLNQTTLQNIKYKFLQDPTHTKNTTNPLLKPILRPKSNIQQASFLTQSKHPNTKSNQKLTPYRYNDKNMTIDVNLENESKLRSISEGLSLKPKNFRIYSKRQKQNHSQLDKHTSFSTIDYPLNSTKSIDKSTQIQTARFLKPNLLLSKANTKR